MELTVSWVTIYSTNIDKAWYYANHIKQINVHWLWRKKKQQERAVFSEMKKKIPM